MADQARDFELAGAAPRIMHALLQTGDPTAPPLTMGVRLEARECVGRFADMTLSLSPFALEYSPTMPEPQLRAWAADLAKALRGET